MREVVAGAQCRVRFFDKADFDGFTVPLAGEHNARNAAAVAVCAAELGLSREQIQQGFSTFRGVKRRMEVRGEAAGVTVIDDFAHHPTAIAETIRAIRTKYPQRRLWALFEPRSNTTRRNIFQHELAESLALADGVFIAQVHRLNELAESERLKPEQIVESLRRAGKLAEYSSDSEADCGAAGAAVARPRRGGGFFQRQVRRHPRQTAGAVAARREPRLECFDPSPPRRRPKGLISHSPPVF